MVLVYKPYLWSQQSQFQHLVKGQLKGLKRDWELRKMMLDLVLIYMLKIQLFLKSNKVVWSLLPLWMDKFCLPIKVELK